MHICINAYAYTYIHIYKGRQNMRESKVSGIAWIHLCVYVFVYGYGMYVCV